MTPNEIQYSDNSRRCKFLGLEIERLTGQLNYQKKSLQMHFIGETEEELHITMVQLERLWGEQIDLFFEIKKENELITNNA
jgi:hypothetical protein